ncbi:MAG: hypothetical protein PHW69_09195, partial [Elusimicrobiaceae bacterium]|nr:hypothetical protein [Elusimicrobiaceae bacterium]
MRLFYQLLIMLVGVGVLPLLPGGAVMLYYQHRAENNALKLHAGLARTTAISVSQYISGLGDRMAFTQELERSLADNNRAAAQWTIELAIASNPDFLLMAVLDRNGRELMRAGDPDMVQRYRPVNAAASKLFQRSVAAQEVVLGEFGSYSGGPGGLMFFPLDTGQ